MSCGKCPSCGAYMHKCPQCAGTGRKQGYSCRHCGGTGCICPHRHEGSSSGCFITTACVSYYGLSDDCYQLRTLRKYRDDYLLSLSNGQELIDKYYSLAPHIVDKLNKQEDKAVLYSQIFKVINDACKEIEKQELEAAKIMYLELMEYLNTKLPDGN